MWFIVYVICYSQRLSMQKYKKHSGLSNDFRLQVHIFLEKKCII